MCVIRLAFHGQWRAQGGHSRPSAPSGMALDDKTSSITWSPLEEQQ